MEFFFFPHFFFNLDLLLASLSRRAKPLSPSASLRAPILPLKLSLTEKESLVGAGGVKKERKEKRTSPPYPRFSSPFLPPSLIPTLSPLSKKKKFRFILLLSRQGKVRLSKWYITAPPRERARLTRDLCAAVLGRPLRGTCNVLEGCDASSSPLLGPLPSGGEGGSAAYPGSDGASSPAKVIYRRYASLYFVAGVDGGDNELAALESVHLLVEALDLYFGNVCELDLVFNFHKAHWLVDELVVGGRLVEPSRRAAVRAAEAQDRAVEEAKAGAGIIEATLGTDEV